MLDLPRIHKWSINNRVQLMLKFSIWFIPKKAIVIPSKILLKPGTIVITAIETQREVSAIIRWNYNTEEIHGFKLKPSTIPLKGKV